MLLVLYWFNVKVGSLKMACNEQGFVQAGHCCLSSPELKPNKEIKVQVNNQMHNRIPSSPNQSTAMQTAEV